MKTIDFFIQIMLYAVAIGCVLLPGTDTFSLVATVQFATGVYHVFSFLLTLLFGFNKLNTTLKNGLQIYGLTVIIYFAIMMAGNYFRIADYISESDFPVMTYVFGLPWLIGCYYTHLTYKIKSYLEALSKRSFLNL